LLDKKGLSLVEVMISLVIVLLVFLALMQTALVSIDANTANILRDEAVSMAEAGMSNARNSPFDSLGTTSSVQYRSFKSMTNFPFTVATVVNDLNVDNKQVDITITWGWKEKTVANGNPYTYRVSTILRRR